MTRKLSVGFSVVTAVLVVVGALTVGFLTLHSQRLDGVLRENYDTIVYCDRMKEVLDRAHSMAQRPGNVVWDATGVKGWRDTFESTARAQIKNSFLPTERERSDAILADGSAYFDRLAVLANVSAADRAGRYASELFPVFEACRRDIDQVAQMNNANLAAVNSQVRSALLVIRNTVICLILAGIGLAIVVVYLTARGIIQPLKQLTASVHELESGNLNAVAETHSDDEIGQLAEAFNEMAAHLREFRRLDELRLARSQLTTQTAIDSLPDAVAVIDPDGIIEISNRTAQQHFGLLPGGNFSKVRPDWAAAYFGPVVQTRTAVTPEGYRAAVQLFDASGERFLLPRALPMLDAEGNLLGVTFILVEVTHLHRADEFRSGLLATVSHELRTPLTSVRMAVRMMLDKRVGTLNDRQATLLEAARTDSERLVRTLEDILTFNRVEAGRERVQFADLPVRDVMDRAMSGVEALASEKRTTIDVKAAKGVVVRADLTLLACALSNLLSNAIKYAPAGSVVEFSCEQEEAAVEFRVIDQGEGIPEALRERVFERFFRVAPSTGRGPVGESGGKAGDGPGGVGLGLSIAREIVQLHEGRIWVEKAERGSCFVIQVPMSGRTLL